MTPNNRQRLAELSEHIITLSKHINAATQKLCEMIRDFDAAEGYKLERQKSCKEWLSLRARMAPSTAAEHLRVARRLGELPAIDAAFGQGELSYSQVRAMTRVADADNEDKLVDAARSMTGAELERHCRGMRARDEALGDREPERFVSRRTIGDGTVELRARLTADEAELFEMALREMQCRTKETAETAEPTESSAEENAKSSSSSPTSEERRRDNRRVDAFMTMVRLALAGGASETSSGGERTQLLVHLLVDDDSDGEEPKCSASLHESGNWLSRAAFERLSCDCSLVAGKTDRQGDVLDIGRKRRTIPPAIRRALRMQQPTCGWPGCNHHAFLDAHHITHWSRDGQTKLNNLVNLCHRHHLGVHEGGFTIARTEDGLEFRAPDGTRIEPPRAAPIEHDTIDLLNQLNSELPTKLPLEIPAFAEVTGRGPDTNGEAYQLAIGGLCNLGFKRREAASAVERVRLRSPPPRKLEAILRAALALLAP